MKKQSVIGFMLVALTACGGKDKAPAAQGAAQAPAAAATPQPVQPAAGAEAPKAPEAAPAAAPRGTGAPVPAPTDAAKAPEAPPAVAKAEAPPAVAPAVPAVAAPTPSQPMVAGSTLVVPAPAKGPADAKVTIIEISDFECPFCSRGKETVDKVAKDWPNDVKVVFKHNPLSFHQRAMPAALASMAAHKQGKFWEMHDKMFANAKALQDADLDKYATELGLDMAKFKADMADPGLRLQIENDQKAAVALGQGGTPAFFINGKVLSGAQPYDEFKKIVEAEIVEADKVIASGKTVADVHKTRVEANLAAQAGAYFASLIDGKAAPKPKRPVDPTVWKAEVAGTEPLKGKADALVTVVIWSDFQCPFCTKVNPTLKQLNEKYPNDVRIVWKNNALPFHNRAMPAAEAALAAHEQGKFWEMHDKLFENQRALEDADLEKYAGEVAGLDAAKWKESWKSGKHKATIDAEMEQASKVNARGTPNFFVNGRNLRGAVPFEDFDALVTEELDKAKKLVEAGTPAADVYKKIVETGKTFEPLDPTVHTFTYDGRPFTGAANGDIVISVYSDFQCPFCARIAPTVHELAKDPELKDRVKVVFKHFPLSFHKEGMPAAVASMAANEQGKFWEMHDKLFAGLKETNAENHKKWAGEIGLDMAKYDAFLAAKTGQPAIDADMEEARKAGLRGTPTIFINGRKFEAMGGYSAQAFKQVINKYFPKP